VAVTGIVTVEGITICCRKLYQGCVHLPDCGSTADVTAKWNALKDTVKVVESSMDQLKKAVDYLRTHSDAGAKELAEEMDAVAKELDAKVREVAASGDAS